MKDFRKSLSLPSTMLSIFAGILVLCGGDAWASIQGTDFRGTVTVTTESLFGMNGTKTLKLDVNGDGVLETLDIYVRQVGYVLSIRDAGEEVPIASFDDLKGEPTLNIAASYLVSPKKPVVVINLVQGEAAGDSLVIFDIVRTVRGLEAMPLLSEQAAWADGHVVLKPNCVEIRTFRDWAVAKFLWDGSEFVKQKIEEK